MTTRRCGLLAVLFLLAAPLAAAEFWFVQITDTHQGSIQHDLRLAKIIDTIATLPQQVAFVVHTGDVAADNLDQANNAERFRAAYAALKVPVYFTAGNHDVLKYHGDARRQASLSAWTNRFGALNHTAEHAGVRLVFVFMENIREKYPLPGHDPVAWLAETLAAEPGKPVLLFQHAPVTLDFYRRKEERGPTWKDNWGAAFRERYRALVNGGTVQAIFGGHFHRDELHHVGEVPLFVSASVAGYWGRQATFRLYHYKDGRISYHTVYIED
jgi:predicted phosphodiesterase